MREVRFVAAQLICLTACTFSFNFEPVQSAGEKTPSKARVLKPIQIMMEKPLSQDVVPEQKIVVNFAETSLEGKLDSYILEKKKELEKTNAFLKSPLKAKR